MQIECATVHWLIILHLRSARITSIHVSRSKQVTYLPGDRRWHTTACLWREQECDGSTNDDLGSPSLMEWQGSNAGDFWGCKPRVSRPQKRPNSKSINLFWSPPCRKETTLNMTAGGTLGEETPLVAAPLAVHTSKWRTPRLSPSWALPAAAPPQDHGQPQPGRAGLGTHLRGPLSCSPSFCFLHWNSNTTSSCPTNVWTGVFKSKTFHRRRLFSLRSWGTITVTKPLLKGYGKKGKSNWLFQGESAECWVTEDGLLS